VGRLERRLDGVEMRLTENTIVEALVQIEIQEMLRVLGASESIEDSVYERVVSILVGAGYIEGDL
jgi:hypothetical protein